MRSNIKLEARYNTNNILVPIKNKIDSYLLKTENEIIRVCYNEEGKFEFVDPSGGPLLRVNSYIEEVGSTIKDIELSDDGYIIKFK